MDQLTHLPWDFSVAPSSHFPTLSYYRVIHKPPKNLWARGYFAHFKSEFSVCIGKCLY